MHADPVDKSRILNRQCESAFPTEKENADIPVLQGNPNPEMPKISQEGVLKRLKKKVDRT